MLFKLVSSLVFFTVISESAVFVHFSQWKNKWSPDHDFQMVIIMIVIPELAAFAHFLLMETQRYEDHDVQIITVIIPDFKNVLLKGISPMGNSGCFSQGKPAGT